MWMRLGVKVSEKKGSEAGASSTQSVEAAVPTTASPPEPKDQTELELQVEDGSAEATGPSVESHPSKDTASPSEADGVSEPDATAAPNNPTSNPDMPAELKEPGNQDHPDMKDSTSSPPAKSKTSQYELQRLENIRRNMEFLNSLGIEKTHFGDASAAKKKKKKRRPSKRRSASKPAAMPLRRSTRRHGLPPEPVSAAAAPPAEPSSEEEPLVFDDSSVLKYTCDTTHGSGSDQGVFARILRDDAKQKRAEPLVGVERLPVVYADSNLKKTYDMDFAQSDGRLFLAAGGHQGRAAVFGLRGDHADVGAQIEDLEPVEPLLSFRAHRSWLAGTRFVQREGAGPPLLLTAANDSTVVLWDIGKQATSRKLGLQPRVAASSDEIHDGGIFSLDVCAGHFATASKDRTCAWSVVAEGRIERVQRFERDSGVVKAVAVRDPQTLASAGNDSDVCIWDVRAPGDTPAALIEDAHSVAVNSVKWCPCDPNSLVTTAFDSALNLWDLRKPNEPLKSFLGHAGHTGKARAIYHPVFLRSGLGSGTDASTAILTGGPKMPYLSLYCPSTLRVLSRGATDQILTSLTAWHGCDGQMTRVVAASRLSSIYMFRPVTQSANKTTGGQTR